MTSAPAPVAARLLTGLQTHKAKLLLFVALTISAIVYYPLTHIYFRSDDFSNLCTIANRGAFYFIVEPFAGHMGFGRNTQFWLLYALFGAKPEAYGWLALLTHLVNVALLFRTARAFGAAPELAAFGAALWGSCPLLVGAIGWYSVYGQSVTGTCLLFVVDRLARLPSTLRRLPPREVLVMAGVLFFGANFFGTGIALVLVAPLALALMARPPLRMRSVFVDFLPLLAIVGAVYYAWNKAFAYYEPRPLAEELQNSVAMKSLGPILAMFGHMLGVGSSGLVQNLWLVPNGDPITIWWLVAVYAGVTIAGFHAADDTDRRRMLALLLIGCAAYGLTAFARANLYLMFGIEPSLAARQIRYHYFSTIPLALTLVIALKQLLSRLRARDAVLRASVAVWTSVSIYFVATTPWTIPKFEDCRSYVDSTLREIERRVDEQPAGSDVYIPNAAIPGYCTGIMGYDRIPGWAGLYATYYEADELRGRRVRFVESSQDISLFSDPKNHRFSKLIVTR